MVVSTRTVLAGRVGIDPKESIPFVTEETNDGIFAVRLAAPLTPGDYGFVLRVGSDGYRISTSTSADVGGPSTAPPS